MKNLTKLVCAVMLLTSLAGCQKDSTSPDDLQMAGETQVATSTVQLTETAVQTQVSGYTAQGAEQTTTVSGEKAVLIAGTTFAQTTDEVVYTTTAEMEIVDDSAAVTEEGGSFYVDFAGIDLTLTLPANWKNKFYVRNGGVYSKRSAASGHGGLLFEITYRSIAEMGFLEEEASDENTYTPRRYNYVGEDGEAIRETEPAVTTLVTDENGNLLAVNPFLNKKMLYGDERAVLGACEDGYLFFTLPTEVQYDMYNEKESKEYRTLCADFDRIIASAHCGYSEDFKPVNLTYFVSSTDSTVAGDMIFGTWAPTIDNWLDEDGESAGKAPTAMPYFSFAQDGTFTYSYNGAERRGCFLISNYTGAGVHAVAFCEGKIFAYTVTANGIEMSSPPESNDYAPLETWKCMKLSSSSYLMLTDTSADYGYYGYETTTQTVAEMEEVNEYGY